MFDKSSKENWDSVATNNTLECFHVHMQERFMGPRGLVAVKLC